MVAYIIPHKRYPSSFDLSRYDLLFRKVFLRACEMPYELTTTPTMSVNLHSVPKGTGWDKRICVYIKGRGYESVCAGLVMTIVMFIHLKVHFITLKLIQTIPIGGLYFGTKTIIIRSLYISTHSWFNECRKYPHPSTHILSYFLLFPC